MSTLSPTVRAALVRAGQIALTFVVFAVFNAIAFHFEVENGVSILFPATAITIIACMYLGIWGAIGVILGTIVTPINDTGQRYFTTPLCGEAKHVDIPEREHPLDPHTIEQLDRYQAKWEIVG